MLPTPIHSVRRETDRGSFPFFGCSPFVVPFWADSSLVVSAIRPPLHRSPGVARPDAKQARFRCRRAGLLPPPASFLSPNVLCNAHDQPLRAIGSGKPFLRKELSKAGSHSAARHDSAICDSRSTLSACSAACRPALLFGGICRRRIFRPGFLRCESGVFLQGSPACSFMRFYRATPDNAAVVPSGRPKPDGTAACKAAKPCRQTFSTERRC